MAVTNLYIVCTHARPDVTLVLHTVAYILIPADNHGQSFAPGGRALTARNAAVEAFCPVFAASICWQILLQWNNLENRRPFLVLLQRRARSSPAGCWTRSRCLSLASEGYYDEMEYCVRLAKPMQGGAGRMEVQPWLTSTASKRTSHVTASRRRVF